MNSAENVSGIAALLCDDRDAPGPLSDLATRRIDNPADIDLAAEQFRRLIVVGGDAQLAMVLTRLVRTDRLDIEVGYVPRWRTTATGVYGLCSGRRAARR
ncbi:MAG: peptidase M50, partial [Mycobacteriaceae bacterium]|nr:peptidase M50 [Mycobacteriaceae bacterium]